jgi:hypothetical protein
MMSFRATATTARFFASFPSRRAIDKVAPYIFTPRDTPRVIIEQQYKCQRSGEPTLGIVDIAPVSEYSFSAVFVIALS